MQPIPMRPLNGQNHVVFQGKGKLSQEIDFPQLRITFLC